ncbi:ATP-binding protein [Candidatus Mcinerneyibacteriota bacterium]|nr:ATP-binding protein [Candidatus Mcinerneyibacteriota bacterium]
MKIAVASGKGGTGKTTVAVNMALSVDFPVTLVDADVEEPNGIFFLPLTLEKSGDVSIREPVVNSSRCTSCGACAKACRFNAIAITPKGAMIFPELCHACGGCFMACREGAITERERVIGALSQGKAGNLTFIQGELNVGEALAPPVIREAKKRAEEASLIIIDSPPGTACPMVAAVGDADFVLLVTEPTPFGLNDLKLAVETVRTLSRPFGVVINRDGIGDEGVRDYCAREGIEIVGSVPDDRAVAEHYSRGIPAVVLSPDYKALFKEILRKAKEGISSKEDL